MFVAGFHVLIGFTIFLQRALYYRCEQLEVVLRKAHKDANRGAVTDGTARRLQAMHKILVFFY